MNIAIQGIQGSFHHLAAVTFFGESVSLRECHSFNEIPELINTNMVDGAIMAIENSITGAFLENYHLIDTHHLSVNGEVYLPMIHNLMALKGQYITDIKEVVSHPIAIQHCHHFFRGHPHIKISEATDTAIVAKAIKEQKLKGVATIASKRAAELFDLNILQEGIQSDELNMTRYFILNKRRNHHPEDYLNNKASLKFITHHQKGNLLEVLTVLKEHDLNLTKIQSLPINKQPWHYAFFVDLTFEDYHQYIKALLKLEKIVPELKVLGEYTQNNPLFE